MSYKGTKVTKDPAANNAIEEGPGIITSDSLAAESLRSGGDFAANQSTPGISSQTSKGLTANTTDTSGARKIEPDSSGGDAGEIHDSAARAGGKDAGHGPTYNTSSASSSSTSAAVAGSGAGSSSSGSTTSQAGIAPTALSNIVDEKTLKPKGANLKEGGEITGSEPNESFRAEIGSKNDPGLAAERKFAQSAAEGVAGAGTRKDMGAVGGDKGGFENLKDEEA